MKFLLISILFSLSASSQDANNFHIEKGQVIWEKDYQGNADIKAVYFAMKTSGDFINIDSSDGVVMANFNPFPADYRGAGYKTGNTSIMFSLSDIDGFVLISFVGNRMKAIIKKIIFIGTKDTPLFKMGEKTNLELLFLNNKGGFKTAKVWNWWQASHIINYSFNKKIEQLIK